MKFNKFPSSIAIIMDGNGRWAKLRSMPRSYGHKCGVKTLMTIADHAYSIGIKSVTVYAFSTENFNRPKEEVDSLMELFRDYFSSTVNKISDRGIKVNVWGDISSFPQDIQDSIRLIESKQTGTYDKELNIAMNYGGRNEIVSAVNKAVKEGKEVDEQTFKQYLYSKNSPDPDIIIRTGGEVRLSNFLLYQCAYSELFFTDTLWPDFTKEELNEIIDKYSARDRRFGRI